MKKSHDGLPPGEKYDGGREVCVYVYGGGVGGWVENKRHGRVDGREVGRNETSQAGKAN